MMVIIVIPPSLSMRIMYFEVTKDVLVFWTFCPLHKLLMLEGHSRDVTGMILLPRGGARGEARCQQLLTASMDGTLRMWDVSGDLLSLEVCVEV